jgi:hypothetical protein
MKYKYNGTDERVFPTLGIIVKPGDEFEAPDNLDVPNVVPAGAHKATPVPPATSAASDSTLGE